MHEHQHLKNRINQVYRRWKRLIWLKGVGIALLSGIVAFLLAFALDSFFELSLPMRLLLLALIGAVILTSIYYEIVRPLMKAPSLTQLARYVEEKYPDLEDRLVTAVEVGGRENPRISSIILEKLLDDTRVHIENLNLPRTVRTKGPVILGAVGLAASVVVAAAILSNLDYFISKSNRIFTPWNIPTIINRPQLIVSPGNARVPKGSEQEIQAELAGFEAATVTLYFAANDTLWEKVEMDRTEENNVYVFNFFDLQSKTRYYVKADPMLSEIYTFNVYDAPHIKRVDLTYIYPEYTGLRPKTEFNTGDVWAPQGTVVRIKAVADKELSGGEVVVGEGRRLKSVSVSDTLLSASFTVTHDTYYKIRVTDADKLSNDPPPEFYVHALPDDPPVLSIEKPGRDRKASMVEEVPVRVQVQDDFGLASLKLFYIINGGEEKVINLHKTMSSKKQRERNLNETLEYSAGHLFYLEDFGLQPGDFLTYHVQATDNRAAENAVTASSDIFFIEVRPFEREYFRPLSQGQMGGGNAPFGGRFSETQKEIIVATWKLAQKKEQLNPEELAESVVILVESQKNLKEVVQSVFFRLQQRSVFTKDSGRDIGKHYSSAVKSMEQALDELEKKRLREALTPEREAYLNLLHAEAQIKEFQMQRAQAQGVGGGANLDELVQLFEDEMDKLKNKYETLRQNQQRQTEQEMDEALQKVKELARRQQRFNQRVRELAREKEITGEEKKRRIEELRRQQERLQRETQELARQMQESRRQGSRLSREIQENLRRASSEMQNASNRLRHENPELAAAKGTRALSRLKRLKDSLQRNLNESLRQQFQSLDQEFQRLADAQEELANEVQGLRPETQDYKEKLQDVGDEKAQLKNDLAKAQKDLQLLSNKSQEAKKAVTRDLKKLSREIAEAQLEGKMERAQKLLEEDRLHSALQAERDIQTILERFSEKLRRLRGEFAETEEEKLDLALSQTERLREDLESLQRQFHQLNKQGEEKEPGMAQEKGGKSAEQVQAGPGESGPPPQIADSKQIEAWNEELNQNLKDLDFINQSIQIDTSLSRELSKISQNLQGILRNFAGGNPEKLSLIEEKILDPLRNFEAELAQKLELLKNKEKLFLAREERVPPQ
ncbi:MAG: DUF4175 family protein, partial [bacterium]